MGALMEDRWESVERDQTCGTRAYQGSNRKPPVEDPLTGCQHHAVLDLSNQWPRFIDFDEHSSHRLKLAAEVEGRISRRRLDFEGKRSLEIVAGGTLCN